MANHLKIAFLSFDTSRRYYQSFAIVHSAHHMMMKLLVVCLGQVLTGCLRLPLEELTQPASIACHQGQCKAGTSLGGTDTQLGSSLEGLH